MTWKLANWRYKVAIYNILKYTYIVLQAQHQVWFGFGQLELPWCCQFWALLLRGVNEHHSSLLILVRKRGWWGLDIVCFFLCDLFWFWFVCSFGCYILFGWGFLQCFCIIILPFVESLCRSWEDSKSLNRRKLCWKQRIVWSTFSVFPTLLSFHMWNNFLCIFWFLLF